MKKKFTKFFPLLLASSIFTFSLISCKVIDNNQINNDDSKKETLLNKSSVSFKDNDQYLNLYFNNDINLFSNITLELTNTNNNKTVFIKDINKNGKNNNIKIKLDDYNILPEQEYKLEKVIVDEKEIKIVNEFLFYSNETIINNISEEFSSDKHINIKNENAFFVEQDVNVFNILEEEKLNEFLFTNKNDYYTSLINKPTENNEDNQEEKWNITNNNLIFQAERTEVSENWISLKFHYTDIFEFKTGKVLVKNLNPFNPFSKVIDIDLDFIAKEVRFKKSELPQEPNQYIFTAISINDKGKSFAYNEQKFKFFISPSEKHLNLNKITYAKNEENKEIFGSIDFDFNELEAKELENKWFILNFSVVSQKDNVNLNDLSFNDKPQIIVPFNKLWKFSLNKLDENKIYKLDKIEVREPFTLKEINKNININKELDTNFSYSFANYNLNDSLLKYNDTDLLEIENEKLLTKRKNLTENEFKAIWMENLNKNSVPFSTQNLISFLSYKRNYHNIEQNKEQNQVLPEFKNFSFIKENNDEFFVNSILGRELINKTMFSFNKEKTQAIIIKDLNRYQNLNKVDDENVLLELNFSLNTKLPNLFNRINNENLNSLVKIYIPLKLLKENKNIEYLPFGLENKSLNKLENKKRILEIKEKFKFSAAYNKETNSVTININSKNNDIKLYDSLTSHFQSQTKSAFISNSLFFVHWLSKKQNDDSITFNETPLNATSLVSGSEETSNQKNSYTLKPEINDKENNAKRLFKENNNEVLSDIRARVFNFQRRGGTYNMIGKVKPNDPNDHRYYVSSAYHVWTGEGNWRKNPFVTGSWWDVKTEISSTDPETGVHIRTLKDPGFKVPIIVSEQESEKTEPSYEDEKKKNSFFNVDFKLEEFINFGDDESFPTYNDFRDNFGNKVLDKNGPDSWERWRSKSDFFVGILDISYFENNYSLETIDNDSNLTDFHKQVVKFFLNWKNLKTLETSQTPKFLSNIHNLSYIVAGYPSDAKSANEQAPTEAPNKKDKRYREYLLSNPPQTNWEHSALGPNQRFQNKAYFFYGTNIDLRGGASGSFVYDSEGKVTSLYTLIWNPTSSQNYTRLGFFLLDGQEYSYFGDGSTPSNPSSFYEKARLLSYLYPEKFKNDDFQNKPDIFYELKK
ncbi:hypothetical protein [Mesomycoplasma molare]|uniref:DUF31 domain-containing protein n=1 Tax=Mesomycoplasma molare TaxID=171288 RepID=A0ABY5TTB5_9BACT|nr:hypothetical protein [Mesomycoplasma molare]UWD33913.1 hypothetical protein NX772_02265 [Mesomycoplasma molare]